VIIVWLWLSVVREGIGGDWSGEGLGRRMRPKRGLLILMRDGTTGGTRRAGEGSCVMALRVL
jgi:hypothetical protein